MNAITNKPNISLSLIVDPYAGGWPEAEMLSKELAAHKCTAKGISALVGGFDVGTIFVILSFAGSSFFKVFLEKLGEDVYGWLKAKRAIKDTTYDNVIVNYHIKVGNVWFIDGAKIDFGRRHDILLAAVESVLKRLEEPSLSKTKTVYMRFDEAQQEYREALLSKSPLKPLDPPGKVLEPREGYVLRISD